MNPKLIILILACGLTVCLSAVSGKAFNYDVAWKEIDKLQSDGLPKSMAAKVDSLYAYAVKEKKVDQQIKALIYQLQIQQQIEEFSAQKAIDKVKAQLETAPYPASAIIHSMLAQLYWSYYQGNRWRFNQRSETVNFKQDDIATWDLKTISKETIKEYQLSLQQPLELQQLSIADYPAFLNQGFVYDRMLRPTLYDLLAYRALDFYQNDESGLTLPFEEFSLTDTKYFQSAAGFATMTISTPDSLSLKYQAALLYQELIRFHLQDKTPSALVAADLERLEFMYKNCALPKPEQYYEAALRLEISRNEAYDISAYASFKLAALYSNLAGKYNAEVSETYRWHYKDALDICQQALDKHPDCFGGKSCKTLMYNIGMQDIKLTAEAFVIPNAPAKVLLSAKNLSAVKLRIYRIPQNSITDNYGNDSYKWQQDDYKLLRAMLLKKPLWTKTYEITNEGDFRSHSHELPISGLPTGRYIIISANTAEKDFAADRILGYCQILSTEISYVTASNATNTLLLANRKTGEPIVAAELKVYQQDYNNKSHNLFYKLTWSGTSDAKGLVSFPIDNNYRNQRLAIQSGSDSLSLFDYYAYTSVSSSTKSKNCLLFTDRSIYRPGQTVYLKGVVYESDREKYNRLVAAASIEAVFYDVNNQVISRQKAQTNEYGTFNCTFTAPKGVLTGQMRIQTNWGSTSISVEEYKRPRFEVTFDKPKETFKLNQDVTVKGKAMSYAGFPIDNAQVSYRILRQPKYPYWFWWWGPSPATPQKEIAHGLAQTDEKGEFTLTFLAAGDDSILPAYNPYFMFTISADVSDISGETRSGSSYISIGEKELILNPVLAEYIDVKDKQLSIPIQATNLSGEPIAVKGNITIALLQAPDHLQKKRLWSAPDRNYLAKEEFLKQFPNDIYASEDDLRNWKPIKPFFSSTFDTPETASVNIDNLANLVPGVYVLVATASYKQQEITSKRYFTVYNSMAKKLPYPVADWFVPVKTTCEPGEKAMVLIGSGYENTSVLYEVEKDHKVIESKRVILRKEQRLFTLPVTEADRGGFYLHFTYVIDGRLYIHDQFINVPWTNKKIDFEYMSFRDKLLPGQQEEWRIKLKDYTGGKISAEVLASMYDASLDAFRPNTWYANVYNSIGRSTGWSNYNFINTQGLTMINFLTGMPYPRRSYASFNWFTYRIDNYGYRNRDEMSDNLGDGGVMFSSAPSGAGREVMMDKMSEAANTDTSVIIPLQAASASIDGEQQLAPKPEDLSGVQARSNFAETAFFYPELRTDENGELSFVFTVPEALTRWKFRALALTKDLLIGTSQNSTVTQKPLMVLPNAPRFFREGDKITFSSKISSLDENDQSGNCQLFLFDAITMAPVDSIFGLRNVEQGSNPAKEKGFKKAKNVEQDSNPAKEKGFSKAQQPFFVKKGESTVLNWELSIPFGIGAVTYRVVARAGDFSDGEENTLPILSNRMLVTESLPLPVNGNSTKDFVFKKLLGSSSSSSIKNHKLTLEYTSNPAWYAVQALPYLMEYPYDCSEQTFSRFYANSLASHIANSNPRIKRVFDSWRDTPNSAALLSNLEKNQELKAVLLQETPWVLDAKNESQSKQRIGLLFDLNNMANQYDAALTKLQKSQKPSGAWPWFPGMDDSWWVTQYIVEGFGHLDHLGVKAIRDDNRIWQMLKTAIAYTDRKILQDYEDIKKYRNLEDDHLSYMEMHYLYARSFFRDVEIPANVAVAVTYFQGQADKYWLNKDLFGQGLIALALHRENNKLTPPKIIASLKERALHNEELGMWWKNDQWGWFWYQAPIETQSLLIEAFNDVTGDTASIDEMRTWLLKQKQTTNWKTTKATAEACYALLISGTEWLNTEQLAEITIGGKKLDPTKLEDAKVEAGTGYFKTSWSGSEITPNLANVSVTNPNRVTSWGALYWQYFEDLDKITTADTPLKLNKKLFIERITDTGKVLDPVSDKSQLAIGDKVIVRIELRSDRDMEYVHMKDMRSAGFEPINVLSQYKWQDGLGYYESTGDAATNFFIEYLRKGTYVFEYPLRVTNKGDFSNGITSIQCMYAPEFAAHSEGIRVLVK